MESGKRGAIILSGGMDSATLLWWMLANGYAKEDMLAVSVNYKQRHSRELDCARELCKHTGVEHVLLDLSCLGSLLKGSSQSDPSIPVPFGRYDEPSMKTTVVPNRNMFMLAAAGAVAIANKMSHLLYGAHSGDHAIYPDCRREFVMAMAQSFKLCDWSPLTLLAPFLQMDKGDICKEGLRLGVPYERTWTCYVGGDYPCGQCGACVERAEAFAVAGAKDPLLEVL